MFRGRATDPEHQPATYPDAGPENEMCLTVPACQAAFNSLWSVGVWFNSPLTREERIHAVHNSSRVRATSGSSGLATSEPQCARNIAPYHAISSLKMFFSLLG